MQELDVIKNACMQALTGKENAVTSDTLFHSVVDPELVMELVGMVEENISAHELETLTILIRNLTDSLEAMQDKAACATLPDQDDLIRHAKYILSIYAR